MERRPFGRTGLEVSRVGLGAAQHGRSDVSDGHVERVLNLALDLGINFIDTAPSYGRSEERIGRFLSHRKDEFTVATKCGCYGDLTRGEYYVDYSRKAILEGLEGSRRRLKLDVIDIFQFHGLPPPELLEEAFEVLFEVKEKGLVRFVGVSADGPRAAAFAGKPTGELDAGEVARRWRVDTWQFTYNIISQEAAWELIPVLRELSMGTIVKRPLSNVVWRFEERPEGDFLGRPWERAREMPLGELARDMPLTEFALRFVLSHPGVDVALVGTISEEHLREDVRYAEKGPLPEEMVRRAKDTFLSMFGT